MERSVNEKQRTPIHTLDLIDCSQSPVFPSQFVKASATWEECLNYRGGP